MTIEGVSAAAGHDKNGNLLGFATTDEIGSVMDMTKTTKNENKLHIPNLERKSQEGGDGCGGGGRRAGGGVEEDEAGKEGWEDPKRATERGTKMTATAEYGSNPSGVAPGTDPSKDDSTCAWPLRVFGPWSLAH